LNIIFNVPPWGDLGWFFIYEAFQLSLFNSVERTRKRSGKNFLQPERRIIMARIYARISKAQQEKLKKLAEENNFRKPSGELNLSQVIRWLIDKEETND
jgi:hypothetical protein